MPDINLPTADRRMVPYRPRAPRDWERADSGARNRIFFAAAHVVADPLSDVEPRLSAALDWEATIAYRVISGRSVSGSRKRWTQRSAAWGSIGRPRSS